MGDALRAAFQSAIDTRAPRFDALLLFSGGKDSAYLLHRLRDEYPRLRILAFTVDNTFMSPVAMDNVASLVEKFDADHVMVRPPARLYDKMFAYAFTHLNAKGCSGTVDQFDGDFFHDVARGFAAQNAIPLVVSGASRTQVERILGLQHFESPRALELDRRTEVAGIKLSDIMSDAETRYWWNGQEWPPDRVPRVLFPYYVWNLSEEHIKAEVRRLGLISPGYQSPIVTNSSLVPLMGIVDVRKLGYSSFEPEFAEMVRHGRADYRLWRHTFELLEYSARTGRFLGRSLEEPLRRLRLRLVADGVKAL